LFLDADDDGSDTGLIIGLTVAAVLAMLVFIGILVVCVWHRLVTFTHVAQ